MHINAPLAGAVLVVRHQPGSTSPSFQVERLRDGKASQPAVLPSPFGFPVEGRPNSDLMRELQWYLETFLDYPFPPETDHADRVLKALRDWGERAFQSLFGDRAAGRMFDAATADDYSGLHLQISSDDPQVLSWPWEALRDPELGVLAHTCQIERRLNTVRDPQPLPDSLPKGRVNILLVVARPYGQKDVAFRSIARLLVELIEKEKVPAHVELLRPPTFEKLREHLRQHAGFYHILHFDGHGAYSAAAPVGAGYPLQWPEGKLVFETDEGDPDSVTADKLSSLLKECAVPAVVLNACQSAMMGGDRHDPFASVATALLRSGMRDVVAMAYSLYVSGAQQFLRAFYRRLFEAGSVAVAVRAGRQQMWKHDRRICVRGEFPLQDWLLPVLYQQDPLSFSFVADAQKQFVPRASKLPEELRRESNPYGFVGRDSAILELERAMRRPPAGILIQGLGGVGKTTLARGFLRWLDETGGLNSRCFWFGFQEIRSAEYVFTRLGEALFGGNFPALSVEQRMRTLMGPLRERRFLLVWDNFESAAGIPGTAIAANLPDSDRRLLAQFLDELRGGATKVVITSRSAEDWLGPQRRYVLPLDGLDREERWEYCNAILCDLGKSINRNDKDLMKLMDFLGGHPQAMRVVLPRLEKMSAAEVLAALRSNLAALKRGGDEQARLYATLNFVEQSLPKEVRPLMALVGMHEGFVDANLLEAIAQEADAGWTRSKIDALMGSLVTAGLLREVVGPIYEMHPLLTSYLRSVSLPAVQPDLRDGWARAFVGVMGSLADRLTPLEYYQQRMPFHHQGQNFYYALSEAERLEMPAHVAALTQSLAQFAENTRNLVAATRLFERFAAQGRSRGEPNWEAGAYNQLGIIAQKQRDLVAAEQWYRRSLDIQERLSDERGAAQAYYLLVTLAHEQRDLTAAEQRYRTSLDIQERLGDERGAAQTYHQLGIVAEERRDFVAAEQWYRRSLAISERLGMEHGAALAYHQLGMVAEERRDFVAAEQWYRKSLAISERLGIEHEASQTYHQLGMVAEERRDFVAAEQWYRKSLAISERLGIEHEASQTYHQLGMVAEERRDFVAAEQWYRKSLVVSERLGEESDAAKTYHQLGRVAAEQHDFVLAEQWHRKSLAFWGRLRDEHSAAGAHHELGRVAEEQRDFGAAEQWYRKSLEIRERLGNEHDAAITYGDLDNLSGKQGNYVESGGHFIKCILIFLRTEDRHLADQTLHNFRIAYERASHEDQEKLEAMWKAAGLGELPKLEE